MVMQKDPYTILEQVGALPQGHFALTSGRHSKAYVNKDALYAHPRETSDLCKSLTRFIDPNTQIVAAPAMGGIILSQWIAYHLSVIWGTEVLAVYAEPGPDDTLVFKREREYGKLIPGTLVSVVEDILTTGGSANKTIDAVRMLKGEVIGVGALFNRGNITAQDLGNVPRLDALITLPIESWEVAECPLCKEGIPLNAEFGK